MPYMLTELTVDRVDLVDEGANSASFIELYKRKESLKTMDYNEVLKSLKPEHAKVIEAEIAKNTEAKEDAVAKSTELQSEKEALEADLAKANEKLEELSEQVSKAKPNTTEEDVLKSMPEEAKAIFIKMREQKEAAEAEILKAKEEAVHNEAVAKAATLKALPIEQDKLVELIKNSSDEVIDVFTAINTAVEGVVLNEIGKGNVTKSKGKTSGNDAWDKIDKAAEEVAKRDDISKQKAVAIVIKEKPDLYQEYLQGGAN